MNCVYFLHLLLGKKSHIVVCISYYLVSHSCINILFIIAIDYNHVII